MWTQVRRGRDTSHGSWALSDCLMCSIGPFDEEMCCVELYRLVRSVEVLLSRLTSDIELSAKCRII